MCALCVGEPPPPRVLHRGARDPCRCTVSILFWLMSIWASGSWASMEGRWRPAQCSANTSTSLASVRQLVGQSAQLHYMPVVAEPVAQPARYAITICRDPSGWLTIDLHCTGGVQPLALADEDKDKDMVRSSVADHSCMPPRCYLLVWCHEVQHLSSPAPPPTHIPPNTSLT